MNKFILRKREKNTHKGTYGKVLVISGSVGMAGAASMCGKAVIKSGAGLVRFAVPREIFDILQISVPEATCIERSLALEMVNDYEAIALGSGIGQNKENIPMLKKVLNEYEGKLVLDADGLNCVMKYSLYGNLRQTKAQVVLTPHAGEAARLLEIDKISEEDREKAGIDIQEAFGTIVVMKGHNTLVLDKNKVYVNDTGNPGMATGGSGDILTGIITSLLAQGYDAYEAAKLGVYIHGLAGDIAATEIGEIGMTAMDILANIPRAFKQVGEPDEN